MLYIGTYKNVPIIFHSIWGIKIFDQHKNEYRHIIGKSAITSLEYGKEVKGFDKEKSNFLNLLNSMIIVD